MTRDSFLSNDKTCSLADSLAQGVLSRYRLLWQPDSTTSKAPVS